MASTVQQGTHNNFGGIYSNQCTWWASERYHQLTGIWVPWIGNANQWAAGAKNAGWQVSTVPPRGIPSIICLQGYAGQGLDAASGGTMYGHVAVVESINSNGSVHTSDFNWYPHLGDSKVVYVDFRVGNGVSFLYASQDAKGAQGGAVGSIAGTVVDIGKTISLAPNADVTQFLASMDKAMQFENPFLQPETREDSILGVSFLDPVDYLEKVGGAIWQDTTALIWRSIFLLLGFFLLYKVLSHFVDFAGIAQQTGSTVARLAPLMA